MPVDDRLVSVIVPVYQRRHRVKDAVASVLEQTHSSVECIVVDDGSTDGSLDAVGSRYGDEPRVRAFTVPHRGVSAARNSGIREAQGQHVTFLDSDDLMPPARIGRQLELLAELSCDGVFGTAESSVMPGAAPPAWFTSRPDWRRGACWMSLLVATAQVRAVGGFDENLQLGEDADLLVRLRGAGSDIRAVDEVFLQRRLFGDNLTSAMDGRTSALRDAIRRELARKRTTAQ
jgi:glycosyltransferase involved in cell wall biosynthesis